jgi:2-dehydropantoate 2-reductase
MVACRVAEKRGDNLVKIAVMGAGGIGGYLGGRLAEAGQQVHLVARGSHLAAIRANGLRIESAHGDAVIPDIHATAEPAEIGPVDLILFTVRLGDVDQAARALKPMVAARTKIVTLQNGIESKDMVGRHVDRAQIAAGVIYLPAFIQAPGVVFNPGGTRRMVVDRMGGDPVMADFFAACERAVGIDAEQTDDADKTVWGKFIDLTAFSGATSIARAPIGTVREHPETLAFLRQLLGEAIAVARAAGQDFDDAHADRTIQFFETLPHEQKSSMLVALEGGRPLELPWLSGKVRALGAEFGIPTPASAAVVAALAAYVDGPPTFEPGGEAGEHEQSGAADNVAPLDS